MLSHIVSDLHESYVNEILKPQLGGGEQKPGGGDRPGEDSSEKKVRQAVYDIRYRARRENVPIESAFNQYMAHSSLSSSEKSIVKEKLGLSRPSGGGDTQKEETEIDEAQMPEFSSRNKSGKSSGSKGKYKVRVTDKLSGKTYVRYATRAKITALRNNPNISSVEMTSYGEPYEGERSKGSSTAKATAGKGLDPVGKEDGDVNNDGKKDSTDKYLLNRRKTIGKAIAKGDKKESFELEVPDKDLKKLAKKASKRVDTNVSGHVDKKDKSMGDYGEFVPSPDGKKKVVTKIGESFSDWRNDLKEIITFEEESSEKKYKEKVNNNSKIKINPELKTESAVIESVELSEEYVSETINCAVDYLVSEGINEEGLEILIDELGLDEFVGFVFEYGEEVLTEARAARKARKGAKSYAEVKAEIDAREKAKSVKKPAPKPVAKAAEVAKKKQPEKKPVRDAIARGVFRAVDAYKKGMDRHRAAMDTAKKAGKVAGAVAKGAGEGVKMAGKAAKVGYKMATKEEVEMDEAMRPGERQRKVAAKRHDPYATSRDRATAHNVAVRGDGPGTPGYEKKSTGGKGARYAGYGDQGAGNKARRRAGQEPLRGNTRREEVEVDEAVYGGTPKKKEEPKDTRMVVTPADKKGNTPAYQNYKKGDKRYKASPHLGESSDSAFDKVRAAIIKKHGAASLHGTPEYKAAAEKRKKEAEARKAKMKPTTDTRSDAEKMADAYASPRKGPGGAVRAD